MAETAPRHVPVQLLLRTAAGTDAEAAAVWSQLSDERLRGLDGFAQALAPVLRPELSAEDARDLLWAYNSPELGDLLVTQRGWSPQQLGAQLARTLISALLPAAAT